MRVGRNVRNEESRNAASYAYAEQLENDIVKARMRAST